MHTSPTCERENTSTSSVSMAATQLGQRKRRQSGKTEALSHKTRWRTNMQLDCPVSRRGCFSRLVPGGEQKSSRPRLQTPPATRGGSGCPRLCSCSPKMRGRRTDMQLGCRVSRRGAGIFVSLVSFSERGRHPSLRTSGGEGTEMRGRPWLPRVSVRGN